MAGNLQKNPVIPSNILKMVPSNTDLSKTGKFVWEDEEVQFREKARKPEFRPWKFGMSVDRNIGRSFAPC